MPIYEYKGQHYDLPDSYTPEQAKARIQSHLAGEQSTGLLSKAADGIGGVAETLTAGAVDMFGGLAAQGLAIGDAALHGKSLSEARDLMAETYGESAAHKALEPQTETGKWLGKKIGEGVESFKDYATDPTQSPLMAIPGVGEDLAKEYGGYAGAVASALPELSALEVPRAGEAVARGFNFKPKDKTPVRGVDANALIEKLEAQPQDRPTPMASMAQQLTAEKRTAKLGDYPQGESVAPDPREVMGRMSEDLQKQSIQDAQYGPLFDQLEKQRLGQEAAARQNAALKQRSDRVAQMSNETQQYPLFDQPQEGRPPSPHEAVPGDWRIDENGMPIKADLSMEAQNLENPMQRNLFGDELPQKHPQEAPVGYMQSMNDTAGALDRSRSLPSIDHFKQMQEEQNALLRHEIPADGRLEAGKLAAEIADPAIRGGDPKMGFDFSKGGSKVPKSQRGAVNPDVFKEGFQKLKQLADGTWLRAYNDGQMLHVEAVKDGHKLGHTTFSPEYIGRHTDERNLKAAMTHVKPEHRGKGYAEEMYKFASDLGNDVQKSDTLTDAGKQMWNKFEQKGIAKNGMLNKQRGAIDPKVFERMLPEFTRSKMRDAEGNLKKFYHGTSKDKDFGEVKPNTRGAWFTDDPKAASQYAKENDSMNHVYEGGRYVPVNAASRVHQVYLNIENPYKWTDADQARYQHYGNYAKFQREFFAELKKAGHDGVDFGDGTVVAFKPDSVKSAISPNGKDKSIKSPGNKQQGVINLGPGKEPERKVLDNIPGIQGTLKGLAPSKWTPEQAIEAAKSAKDLDQNALQKLSNWFTKGGQYMTDRADNNPVIRYTTERVRDVEGKTRADVENLLHDNKYGLGAATRDMSAAEQKNIWALMDWADHNQKDLTPEMLREHGATDAQIRYVEIHRQVMDHAHEQMSKVWQTLGKGNVTKRTAYAAMNASGDYRRVVYKDDKVVGMIGSDLRWRVNGLKTELEKRGYTVGEERYVGAKSRDIGSAQAEMQQMLEFFAKNDPHVDELMNTVSEVTSNMARGFMNMEVHTKAKKGIFGMDGRKAVDGLEWGGTTLTRDKALANAREGLKAQLSYAEMAIKWGHITDAVQDVKKLLSDKDVVEKQPLAAKWSEDYVQKALGANPTFGRKLEQWAGMAMGETGIGYSNVRTGIAAARTVVNTMLLGLRPSFWLTNVIQPMQAMPGMKAMLVSKGLKADFDFGTGWTYLAKGGLDAYKAARTPGELGGLAKEAYTYARQNHVYGSDLIEHSNHIHKGLAYNAERISGSVSGKIEAGTRAPVFFGFVHMLAENGMSKENGLFETAHNLTDMAMNNYSRTERPKAYDAIGPVGELASNLASYKHNEMSRLAMFARMVGTDKTARPLLVHLTSAILAAGVKGVVGYTTLDWLIKEISSLPIVGKPTSLTKELMNFSEWVGGKTAPHLLSHGLFSLMGVDMSNRLGIGDAASLQVFPGGQKLVDMGSAAVSAAYHRDEASTKQMIKQFSPGVAEGPEDLAWFSKGDLGSRQSDFAGTVNRTKGDKYAKAVGLTGIHEAVEKTKMYENKWVEKAYTDLRNSATNTMKGEIYMNKAPSAKSIQKYMDARGDISSLLKEIDRIGKDQNMSQKDREMLRAATLRTPAAQEHLKDLVGDFNENK